MYKVVQLQYKMSPSGDFARRFQEAYANAGIQSSILSLYSDIPTGENLSTLGTKERLKAKLNNNLQSILTRKVKKEKGLFSHPLLGTDVSQHPNVRDADIIILHWVLHGFLSLKNIRQLAKTGKPIIFILHDMWPITGGCHYADVCNNYLEDCSTCPMFGDKNKSSLAASGFNNKKKLYQEFDNLYFISPSSWLADCARNSRLTKDKPIYHIPNFLNRDIFKPHDQHFSRDVLNIARDETVLAFGAVAIDSPYKGWTYLMATLKKLASETSMENTTLLLFGGIDVDTHLDNLPFKIKKMGKVMSEYEMSMIYNASNLFIAPSINDNLPYTVFESLACGTPVVAFNTGGIPDMIIHKENGYLARYKDIDDLTNGIIFTLHESLQGYVPTKLDNEESTLQYIRLFDKICQPAQ